MILVKDIQSEERVVLFRGELSDHAPINAVFFKHNDISLPEGGGLEFAFPLQRQRLADRFNRQRVRGGSVVRGSGIVAFLFSAGGKQGQNDEKRQYAYKTFFHFDFLSYIQICVLLKLSDYLLPNRWAKKYRMEWKNLTSLPQKDVPWSMLSHWQMLSPEGWSGSVGSVGSEGSVGVSAAALSSL